MPFHLAYRALPRTTAVRSVLQVARTLEETAGSDIRLSGGEAGGGDLARRET
jgi:hypothetical protein